MHIGYAVHAEEMRDIWLRTAGVGCSLPRETYRFRTVNLRNK
jgi:hypothetical protein